MRIFFLQYAYEKGLIGDIAGFRKLWELAERFHNIGHQVVVFYPKIRLHKRVKHLPSKGYFVWDMPLVRPLTAYLNMFLYALAFSFLDKPDAIYFRTCPSVLPVLLGKLLRVKVVLEINSALVSSILGNNEHLSFKRWIYWVCERFNIFHADRLVVLTDTLKKVLVEKLEVDSDKILIAPTGTDVTVFSPQDSLPCRRKIGLNAACPVIGFVGIFYPYQGVDVLIKAASHILKRYSDTRFMIVGDGIMRQSWESLVRLSGLNESFLFTGQVPYTAVSMYYNAMDVTIGPLGFSPGHTVPFKVVDALACGKVVVCASVDSLYTVANDANGALIFVPPNDPQALVEVILKLLGDSGKLKKLGEQGRLCVSQKYTWDHITPKIAEFIEL